MICVVMTAFASYENAVSAIKAGAYDYLPETGSPTEQVGAPHPQGGDAGGLQRENSRLRAGSGDWFDGLTSPKCQALQSVVERIAPSDATVLLSGETGSGKTELARSIHRRSARADKPFVEVTCTAIAENLFESEVFGHVRGAFTGAVRDKAGKFELADNGTIFLMKSGRCPLKRRVSLLRSRYVYGELSHEQGYREFRHIERQRAERKHHGSRTQLVQTLRSAVVELDVENGERLEILLLNAAAPLTRNTLYEREASAPLGIHVNNHLRLAVFQ